MRRKVIWYTAFLFFAVHAQAQESYLVKPDVQGCINVRDDFNINADIIACLSANSLVTVLSTRPYWREINFGQPNSGWIAKKLIIPTPPPVEPVPDPLPNDMWMTVHFIDVGQGDAIWINTPDDGLDGNGIFEGKNIIIDAGLSTSEAVNGDHVVLRTNGSVIEVLQGVQATCAGLAAQTSDQNCT